VFVAVFGLFSDAHAATPSVTPIAKAVARTASPTENGSLQIDPALAQAASRHVREVLADEKRANRDRVDDALRIEGLADAQLLPFTSIGTDPAALTNELLKFAEETVRARGMTHVGVAIAEGQGRVALGAIFSRRLVELTPLPRAPKSPRIVVRGRAKDTMKLEAILLGPCDAALERCAGEVKTVPHKLLRTILTVPITLSGRGRYAFELIAESDRGPEIAALWSFDYGAVEPEKKEPPLEDLGALIDRARSSRELAPLSLDPALRAAASAHANEVCGTMIAAHVSEKSGDPKARAEKAGYRGRVTENVAIASSIQRAHANLMKSPSHRRNVLDPLAASTGLAVVKRDSAYCVVELFGFPAPQGR
jgi:hypothetical protein